MKRKTAPPEPVDTGRAYCRLCKAWFPVDADNTDTDHLIENHLELLIAERDKVRR